MNRNIQSHANLASHVSCKFRFAYIYTFPCTFRANKPEIKEKSDFCKDLFDSERILEFDSSVSEIDHISYVLICKVDFANENKIERYELLAKRWKHQGIF